MSFIEGFTEELEKRATPLSYAEAKRELLKHQPGLSVKPLEKEYAAYGDHYYYSPGTGKEVIYLSKKPRLSTALHELGHKEQPYYLNNPKVIRLAPAVTTGAGLAAIPFLMGKSPQARLLAPLIAASGWIPQLAAEYSASARGYQKMKVIDPERAKEVVRKRYGPSFASYLVDPAAVAGGTAAAAYAIPALLKRLKYIK